MSELMRLDEEYRNWIQELGDRYRTSQIKASIRVNNEMLMYYWSVGKDITERRADSKWGNKFFQNMSMDMSDMIPNAKGFSPTNLRYMMRFYGLYKDIVIVPQVGERLLENNGNQIVPQVEEQFEMASNKVFMIPWGHIKLLIDKCHDNPEKFDFYVNKVIENNWSRAVILYEMGFNNRIVATKVADILDEKYVAGSRKEIVNLIKRDSNIRRKIEGVLQNYPTYFSFKFEEIVYE